MSGATKFVGREEELEHLHQLLQQNDRVAIAAIAGMGGVGKTELALQYAIAHRETYQGGICWLLALQDVGLQIVQFARIQLQLNPPEDFDLLAQVVYCWRNWREGEVLLVLDNVTDYKQVKPYLETSSSRFKVLMTTREKLQPPIVRLDLDVLKPRAAMNLLKSLIGRERLQREPWVARKLCKWLGYLPLGLELVGRYLALDEDLSLTEMLQRLEDERLKDEALDQAPPEMTAERGVTAAFELSWQRLNENGQFLGCLLSLFALSPIPWEVIESMETGNKATVLKKARPNLLQLHLLQRKGEGIYQLHPLLREFFQMKLQGLEVADDMKSAFAAAMVKVAQGFPETPNREQIKAVSTAMPHIAEVANNLTTYLNDKDIISPFLSLGRFYQGQGFYEQAEPWYKQCLEVTKKRLGEEHRDVAPSWNNLAYLYNSQGRYAEAEPLYLQALELRRRLLGEEHPDVALSLNNLAYLYNSQGRYAEAEPLYLQALELRRRLLGEEHPDVATSLNNLAGLYNSQGRYAKAEPLYLQALTLIRRLLGEEHPHFATSLNNLAGLYNSQGRYAEAEPLYLQALELTRRLLGEEHPHFASKLNNLATMYNSQGRYAEAELLLQQALELMRRLLGDEHPDVATNLNNLAGLYYSQGRYAEAEPLIQQALELRRRLLGEEHPDVANDLNNLAAVYQFQGRYSEAEPLYKKALEISERSLGIGHPLTIKIRGNYVICLRRGYR
ncbi:tetratricopeptide repeat protein [Scytonema sp. PRP1]|uniref:tetratricopeptide repeat protein n=1 Tax=Scytonema sp. PRP1 TaxID=3120513 RepID=UPI003FA71A22